jgi:hypothetical protein
MISQLMPTIQIVTTTLLTPDLIPTTGLNTNVDPIHVGATFVDEGEVSVVEGEATMIGIALLLVLTVDPKPTPTLHPPTAP